MERFKKLKAVISKLPENADKILNNSEDYSNVLPNQQLAELGGETALKSYLALNQDIADENEEEYKKTQAQPEWQALKRKYGMEPPKIDTGSLLMGPVSKMASKSLANEFIQAKEGDDLVKTLARLTAEVKTSPASGAAIYEQLGKSPNAAINDTINKIKMRVPGLKVDNIDEFEAAMKGDGIITRGEFYPDKNLIKTVIDKNRPFETLSTLEHEGIHALDNQMAKALKRDISDSYSPYYKIDSKNKKLQLRDALEKEKLGINPETKNVNSDQLSELYKKLMQNQEYEKILKIENALKNPHFKDQDIKNLELERVLDHYRQMDSNLNEKEFEVFKRLFPKIKKP